MPDYSYTPVIRMITIEIRPSPKGDGEREILVTPTHAEVRSGDTIAWVIQGAPAGAAVTIRNFHFKGAIRVVSVAGGGGWELGEPPLLGVPTHMSGHPDNELSTATAHCAIGVYGYEIFVGDYCVIDPDVEIKPPRDC